MSETDGTNPDAHIVIDTRMEDGNPVCIRTIRKDDVDLMRIGIGRMSQRSRYLRFFSGASSAPDWVIERLVSADGHKHLAWGAIDCGREDKPAIGAVHAFRNHEDEDCAEFSVAILDDYHGRGLGKLLTATILLDAREEGITEFQVHMLAENTEALEFTRSLGGEFVSTDREVREFHLDVETALARLREECSPPGIAEVFRVLG